MTDDGMMFFATITAANGATLNRETPNRRELLEWLATHGRAGTVSRIGMEAQTPDAVHKMLIGLVAGQVSMDRRARGETPADDPDAARDGSDPS